MEEIDFISNAEGRQSSKLSTIITNVAWVFIVHSLRGLGLPEWVERGIGINKGACSPTRLGGERHILKGLGHDTRL